MVASAAPLKITPVQVPGILTHQLPKYQRLPGPAVAERFGNTPLAAYRKLPGLLVTLRRLDPDFTQYSIAEAGQNEVLRVTGRGEFLVVRGNGAISEQRKAIAAVVDLTRKKVMLMEQNLDGWLIYGIQDPMMAAIALEATQKIASPVLSGPAKAPASVVKDAKPIGLAAVARLFQHGPLDWSALERVSEVRWSAPKPRREGQQFARSGKASFKDLDQGSVSFQGDDRQASTARIYLEDFELGGTPAIVLAHHFSKPAEVVTMRANCPDGTESSVFKITWPEGVPVLIHINLEHALTASQSPSTSFDIASREQDSWKCR
jgi:hypothetical protein